MTRDVFVSAVLQNALTVRGYKIGCDGRDADGLCDCIGLIKGAFAILDVPWGGGPGTNYCARNYIDGLKPFDTTLELKKGDVVLKRRAPGDNGYSLPDTYKNDPDQYDYYHIGVVTSDTPLKITHCTTVPGGIQVDQGKKNWSVKGKLRPITDEGGKGMGIKAIVTADNGLPVNLRSRPEIKDGTFITKVPLNSEVDILEEGNEWSKVKYQGITGYMMTKYLVPVASDMPPEEGGQDNPLPYDPPEGEPYDPGDETVMVPMPLTLLVELYSILDKAIGKG